METVLLWCCGRLSCEVLFFMKTSKWLPLCVGASAIAFSVGACFQRATPPQNGLQRTALAQGSNAPIRTADDLAQLGATYARIARKVTPAVVNIQAVKVQPGRTFQDPYGGMFGDDGSFGGRMLREPDRKSQSIGSGVIISSSGLIISNNHVAGGATQLTVTLSDRRRFPAKLLGTDPASDMAVLKIDAPNLPVLKFVDSDKVNVGDIVLAVGSPFNLSSTVTQGIISAKGRRDLGISAYEDFLQTDAAINPGNSGGALVDINGDLVGINTAILSESGGNQGIGLAIPSNLARSISGQLAQSGKVTRGWLGVVVDPLTGDVADRLGLGNQGGVVVTGLYGQAPAAQIPWSERGVDVILSANGKPVDSPGELRNLVANMAPGSALKLRVWSNGQTKDYSVTVGTRPARAQGV